MTPLTTMTTALSRNFNQNPGGYLPDILITTAQTRRPAKMGAKMDLDTATDDYTEWAIDRLFGPGIDSNQRAFALADELEAATAPEQVWALFHTGWPGCGAVPHYVIRDVLKVLKAQPRPGTEFLDGDAQRFFDSLPETVIIYRGASPDRRLGMAWTTDILVAKDFAIGHRNVAVEGGLVYRAEIPKSAILTVVVDREESEIIIDPDIITDTMEKDAHEVDGMEDQ